MIQEVVSERLHSDAEIAGIGAEGESEGCVLEGGQSGLLHVNNTVSTLKVTKLGFVE